MRTLVLLCLLFTSSVLADDSLYLSLHSYHYDRTKDYNESHDLLGLEYNSFFVQHFTTSKRKESWHVGYIKRDIWCFNENLCIGGDIGLITGYSSSVQPVIFPMITWVPKEHWGTDVIFGSNQVVALRVRYIY